MVGTGDELGDMTGSAVTDLLCKTLRDSMGMLLGSSFGDSDGKDEFSK